MLLGSQSQKEDIGVQYIVSEGWELESRHCPGLDGFGTPGEEQKPEPTHCALEVVIFERGNRTGHLSCLNSIWKSRRGTFELFELYLEKEKSEKLISYEDVLGVSRQRNRKLIPSDDAEDFLSQKSRKLISSENIEGILGQKNIQWVLYPI